MALPLAGGYITIVTRLSQVIGYILIALSLLVLISLRHSRERNYMLWLWLGVAMLAITPIGTDPNHETYPSKTRICYAVVWKQQTGVTNMRVVQKQHIVDVFVWVDDTLPKQVDNRLGGRPTVLTDSELLTILIWDGLTEPHKNLSAMYSWIEREYHDCFPKLPAYQNFVAHVHRLLPQMVWLLQSLLASRAPLRFADSTMLPVCKPIRADRHRVAKGVAQFGKNWQGWHYGFKLHAAIDHNNRLAAIVFTPASEHDNQHMERLVNGQTKILVGDSHYGGSVMRKRLWKKHRTVVIAPPHHTQRKKVATSWQILLLHMRPKIEATFGKLKEHHFLVTSFPRSVTGYFVHYIRTLLGYQMGVVS